MRTPMPRKPLGRGRGGGIFFNSDDDGDNKEFPLPPPKPETAATATPTPSRNNTSSGEFRIGVDGRLVRRCPLDSDDEFDEDFAYEDKEFPLPLAKPETAATATPCRNNTSSGEFRIGVDGRLVRRCPLDSDDEFGEDFVSPPTVSIFRGQGRGRGCMWDDYIQTIGTKSPLNALFHRKITESALAPKAGVPLHKDNHRNDLLVNKFTKQTKGTDEVDSIIRDFIPVVPEYNWQPISVKAASYKTAAAGDQNCRNKLGGARVTYVVDENCARKKEMRKQVPGKRRIKVPTNKNTTSKDSPNNISNKDTQDASPGSSKFRRQRRKEQDANTHQGKDFYPLGRRRRVGMKELQLKEIFDDDSVSFIVDRKRDCPMRCKIDAKASLRQTGWWDLNKPLFKGHTGLLRKAINGLLKTWNWGETSIFIYEKQIKKIEGEDFQRVTINPLRSKSEIGVFEDILANECTPVLLQGDLKAATLLNLEGEDKLYLGLKDSLYFSVMKLLKDPRRKQFIQKRIDYYMKLYEVYYNKYGVKQFLAPMGEGWDQLYRVEVLSYDNRSKEFHVSYVDLGLEGNLKINKFACMTRMRLLPPFLKKLPPQVVFAELTNASKMENPIPKCLEMVGTDVMIKVAEEQFKTPLRNYLAQVRLFRCPVSLKKLNEPESIETQYEWIQERDVKLCVPKDISEEARQSLRTLYITSRNDDDGFAKNSIFEDIFDSCFVRENKEAVKVKDGPKTNPMDPQEIENDENISNNCPNNNRPPSIMAQMVASLR